MPANDPSLRLLAHFDRHRRDLPWRRDVDPYQTWVSEIMLQQTQVSKVIPFYERWMKRFPTVTELANADLQDVLHLWSGLGYYQRARNLHRAAGIVCDSHDGELPDTTQELRSLPGVGAYTAGAIASIAFGRNVPAVDGNVRRVLSRLFDLADPKPAELERTARALIPKDRPGDFNQALMELGATICKPRSPRCEECPIESGCLAARRNRVEERPAPRRSSQIPTYHVGTALLRSPSNEFLLVRRMENGLLGGMWEFPGLVASHGESHYEAARRAIGDAVGGVRHVTGRLRAILCHSHRFTHRRHVYHVFEMETTAAGATQPVNPRSDSDWTAATWIDLEQVDRYPLPAAQSWIARRVAESAEDAPC